MSEVVLLLLGRKLQARILLFGIHCCLVHVLTKLRDINGTENRLTLAVSDTYLSQY